MAKIDRLQDVIYFGENEIVVTEQSHKKTKQFLKLLTGVLIEGNNVEFTSDRFPLLVENILLEKPFEALSIFVPELTEEVFDEATNRELLHAFKTVLRLNGIDIEKLIKNVKPLISTVPN